MSLCLVSPDGLFRGIFGPRPGATNDIKLMRQSRLLTIFHDTPFKILGDSIFPTQGCLVSIPDTAQTPTRELREVINSACCRGEIEHAFGF